MEVVWWFSLFKIGNQSGAADQLLTSTGVLGEYRSSWKALLEKGMSGIPFSTCCHHNMMPQSKRKMDECMDRRTNGWTDGWINKQVDSVAKA